ncbi:disease resistance protein At4g27190-like [Vitis riparia]|uniref:disease resistance protein At4g27190-like n=1 Tax=Vitis riparia TaxID=96939 RepID=UPI00155A9FE6|nr:disease resistance protein At4g27190-like [Vitis riparia]
MEYVEAVLTSIGLLKDMWPSISKCFNYHKILDKNCKTLKEKMERLKSREQDIKIELQNAQYQRKKEKKEVENWLKEVQNMKDDLERMEQEVGKGRIFSRLGFLRQSEEHIEKTDELLERGRFPEGILIDLQDVVAEKINLDLSKEEDERLRSALLFEALQKEKKFVLIFDDVWEVYPPREVGIPIGVDGGKLIITTRSREVCLKMGCKEIIKVEPLYEEEAWELFNKTLERYNALSQKEEKIAKDIVRECAGLPLAIVTTARSMSVAYDIAEWRNALNELREHVKGHTINMENDVFKILEFSYNRLNDEKLQECLLYCALFPEDYKIRRVLLIRYWIVEGLVEEMGSRQAERDRGHAILNKLENGHGHQHNKKEFSIHGEKWKKSGRSAKRDRVVK